MSIEIIRPEGLPGEWTLTSSPRLKPGGGSQLDRRTGRSRPDPAKDAREASKRGPDAAASAWAKARMGKTPPNPPDRH